MSLAVVAKHLGYKSTNNGAFIPVLSALKKYGVLVAATGGEVRVSDDAAAIFLLPPDAPERKALIKKLALLPPIFGKVLEKFPGAQLPSDQNLRAKLRLDFNFASDEAADTMIRTLRASITIAGLDQEGAQAESGGAINGTTDPSMTTAPEIVQTINRTSTQASAGPAGSPAAPSGNRRW